MIAAVQCGSAPLTDDAKKKLLVICDSAENVSGLLPSMPGGAEMSVVQNPVRGLAMIAREQFDGVFISAKHLKQAIDLGRLVQNERVLEGMPDGVVLLDQDNQIIYSNGRLCEWCKQEQVVGRNFFSVLDSPEILGPDFCPFRTALATGQSTGSTLRTANNHYFRIHAAPLIMESGPLTHLVVTLRDVTDEVHQQQKLAAIHQAGAELADLTPEELLQMSARDRVELLKSNIIHFTKDLLNFEVIEIRLLDPKTRRLMPLLNVGMTPEAAQRELMALPQKNGVTGFVAATGKSYLCEDTTEDPLYIEGIRDAKSSLTVPLILHNQVIGTFNVESHEPHAFSESDLQFLEIFGRNVAVALNTLELLAAEQGRVTAEAVEVIHSAVALPVDEILNEAVNVMERYIGHDPDVVDRLKRILRNARDIKQLIQQVGRRMAPVEAHPQAARENPYPKLVGLHILVVDDDETVRIDSHNLLERYGCVVETAHDGAEALSMIKGLGDEAYDIVIAAFYLPDMSAYDLLLKLQEIAKSTRLILMSGYGYDAGHVLVKCRRAGLPSGAVLVKPFRPAQLLSVVQAFADPSSASPGPADPEA